MLSLAKMEKVAQFYSISAGLDYPGVGQSMLSLDSGRVEYAATDDEAVKLFFFSAKTRRDLPAIESSHTCRSVLLIE